MKPSSKQIHAFLDSQHEDLQKLRHDFIMEHVPRLHRLLMEAFPHFRQLFDYKIAGNEDDPTKLTLLKGKKVIARNFVYE